MVFSYGQLTSVVQLIFVLNFRSTMRAYQYQILVYYIKYSLACSQASHGRLVKDVRIVQYN